MAYLTIANGRDFNRSIVVMEDEPYRIDRYTTKLLNSDKIREKYPDKLKEYKERYPYGYDGSVRFFSKEKDDSIREWRVLYKKHVIAFPEIMKNKKFVRTYALEDRRKERATANSSKPFYSLIPKYELIGILDYNFQASVNRLIKGLKEKDREKDGVRGGGKAYFSFLRNVITRYMEYQTLHPECPTIEAIYEAHFMKVEKAKIQKPSMTGPAIETPVIDFAEPVTASNYNRIHDEYLTEEEIEGMRVDNPFTFFDMPLFDRYYGDLFTYNHIILTGDRLNVPELYKKLYEVCAHCFNGSICCPQLGKEPGLLNKFNDAKALILLTDELTPQLKYSLTSAKQSEIETVLFTDNKEIIEWCSHRFKNAHIIEPYIDNFESVKALVEVFEKLHHKEYKERVSYGK
jgi:hypothetical protein